MQPREKISKSSWMLLASVKDSATANITNAIRSGQLKIEASQATTLLALIGGSIDEGYHKAHKNFMKEVDAGLNEAVMDAELAVLNEQDITKKK